MAERTGFDNTTVLANGSGFGGNCGTGGGAVNEQGEFVAYCPHDSTGIYVFSAANSSNFSRLELSPRPQLGENCSTTGFHCAMTPPPPNVDGLIHIQPSDPGTPFKAGQSFYQVWGNRGENATVFLYKAPAGDKSLRSFAFEKVLFSGGYVPPQFCHAYGPFSNSSCDTAYRAWGTECPDYMLIGEQPLLISSLGD